MLHITLLLWFIGPKHGFSDKMPSSTGLWFIYMDDLQRFLPTLTILGFPITLCHSEERGRGIGNKEIKLSIGKKMEGVLAFIFGLHHTTLF